MRQEGEGRPHGRRCEARSATARRSSCPILHGRGYEWAPRRVLRPLGAQVTCGRNLWLGCPALPGTARRGTSLGSPWGAPNSWEGSRRTHNRGSGHTYLTAKLGMMENADDALDAPDAEDFGDTASRLQVAPMSPEQALSAVVEEAARAVNTRRARG